MSQVNFFDEYEADLAPPTFIRGVSDDLYTSLFYCPMQQTFVSQPKLTIIPQQDMQISSQSNNIPQFQKYARLKIKTKGQFEQKKDYKKNICGYITKKIVREFMSATYKDKVMTLCEKYGCSYVQCIDYYDKRIERITGPTHLNMLLNVNKEASDIKMCFKEFFIWFLRFRYLRYLIIQGKMQRKDIYIDYKNKTLLYLGCNKEITEEEIHENYCESKQTH